MSDKAQTTRNKIQGVMTQEDAQIIFLDTPGIHKPKHKLGDYMMRVATNTLSEIDAIMFMVNVNEDKSTFVNSVIGHKIAIMSDKAQTTRNKIQGVMTQEDAQIIFLDTPGIHKPKHKLGDYMMRVATNTLSEIDAIMFMVNVNED